MDANPEKGNPPLHHGMSSLLLPHAGAGHIATEAAATRPLAAVVTGPDLPGGGDGPPL